MKKKLCELPFISPSLPFPLSFSKNCFLVLHSNRPEAQISGQSINGGEWCLGTLLPQHCYVICLDWLLSGCWVLLMSISHPHMFYEDQRRWFLMDILILEGNMVSKLLPSKCSLRWAQGSAYNNDTVFHPSKPTFLSDHPLYKIVTPIHSLPLSKTCNSIQQSSKLTRKIHYSQELFAVLFLLYHMLSLNSNS